MLGILGRCTARSAVPLAHAHQVVTESELERHLQQPVAVLPVGERPLIAFPPVCSGGEASFVEEPARRRGRSGTPRLGLVNTWPRCPGLTVTPGQSALPFLRHGALKPE